MYTLDRTALKTDRKITCDPSYEQLYFYIVTNHDQPLLRLETYLLFNPLAVKHKNICTLQLSIPSNKMTDRDPALLADVILAMYSKLFEGYSPLDVDSMKSSMRKVDAVLSMPALTNRQGVMRLLDMAAYLARLTPAFSDVVALICELLHRDVEFHWEWTRQNMAKHRTTWNIFWHLDRCLPTTKRSSYNVTAARPKSAQFY